MSKCVCSPDSALDPNVGDYRAPIPLDEFKGPTSNGREGQGGQGKGRERVGKWRERGILALLFPHFESCCY